MNNIVLLSIFSISLSIISCVVAIILFVLWRRNVHKYSLDETKKTILKFRKDFDEIISQRLEITQDRAIEITERFNQIENEIEYFNSKMRIANTLLLKLDNTNDLIQNTIEKNISRDEAIVTINREVEELKEVLKGSGGNISQVVEEMLKGMEEGVLRIKGCEKDIQKLKKDFDSFENIISQIISRLKALEDR